MSVVPKADPPTCHGQAGGGSLPAENNRLATFPPKQISQTLTLAMVSLLGSLPAVSREQRTNVDLFMHEKLIG